MFKAVPASILLHFCRIALSSLVLPQIPRERDSGAMESQPMIEGTLIELNARQEEKAARADDAEIPIYLWDERFWQSTPCSDKLSQFMLKYNTEQFRQTYSCKFVSPLQILRHIAHIRWIRNIFKDFVRYAERRCGRSWINQLRGTVLLNTTIDALNRAARSSFWEWLDGSTLILWHWPKEQIDSALYGYPYWIVGNLPRYRVPQRQ